MPNVQDRVLVTESESLVPLMSIIIKIMILKVICKGESEEKANSADSNTVSNSEKSPKQT